MFRTEPGVKTSNTWELSNSRGARNQRRGTSMRAVKAEYNRKLRRVLRTRVAEEFADYRANGAY